MMLHCANECKFLFVMGAITGMNEAAGGISALQQAHPM
jgi:hypothetical protein